MDGASSSRAWASTETFAFIDLDQFKLVNDTVGHGAGDELLRQVAGLLGSHIRHGDTLGRLGGDEFGLLLPDRPRDRAVATAERLFASLAGHRFVRGGRPSSIGASIGLVGISADSGGSSTLLAHADVACCAAKDSGRGRVRVYEGDDDSARDRHAEIRTATHLRDALDRGQLRMVRQPIVSLAGAEPTRHFEALVRMVRADGSLALPSSFIPAAERFGLMVDLDRWVVRSTPGSLVTWPDHETVAIDLSGTSLADPSRSGLGKGELERLGLDPRRVGFEITETAAIRNLPGAQAFIREAREIGCLVSLDDFGSGMSSFGYLKTLPVDFLKIDGFFVRELEDPTHEILVQAMHDLAHALNIRTVGEGAETEELVARLRAIGVDRAQGWALGRPEPMPGDPGSGEPAGQAPDPQGTGRAGGGQPRRGPLLAGVAPLGLAPPGLGRGRVRVPAPPRSSLADPSPRVIDAVLACAQRRIIVSNGAWPAVTRPVGGSSPQPSTPRGWSMADGDLDRRDLLRLLLGSASIAALDWSALPRAACARTPDDPFDAVIIGAGLGGLSCAAAFVRQGFRPLVLEQRDRPGGYATSFKRGEFEFDGSLHSTTVSRGRDGSGVVPGFPELDIEFVPHPNLYRVIFPNHDVRVPQKNVRAYRRLLARQFPGQARGLRALFRDMEGLADDSERFHASSTQPERARIPVEFPFMFRFHRWTWGEMMDARLDDAELKAILSAHWGYFALPPSRLAALYYAIPVMGYLRGGGYYPRGRSQHLSNLFADCITSGGGELRLGTRVASITTEGGVATGVTTDDGEVHRARVVVSNADAFTTFNAMLGEDGLLSGYRESLAAQSVSLSGFQVFLGLKRDLLGELGVADSEVFCQATYDLDVDYARCRDADVEGCAMTATLYDNIYEGYSPPGKNTLNILVVQGYDHWEPFEADYRAGRKAAYRAEKQRLADLLIARLERVLLPGLFDAIEVRDAATPLTYARLNGSHRGAIYGFDQVIGNSGPTRIPHRTPIEGLYLAGAWTTPGHGYSGVVWSGLECFSEVMQTW